MKKQSITEMLISIAASELIGVLSALFTGDFTSLFRSFVRPPLMPPQWVFPVVWTILYALMGISAYLVYSAASSSACREKGLWLYALQLAANFSWSIVFFRFELLWGAFAVILLITALVAAMMICFYKARPLAAYLNIPSPVSLLFQPSLPIPAAVLNCFQIPYLISV